MSDLDLRPIGLGLVLLMELVAWKPVEGKVIPLYQGWHPRWLAGFFFHQQYGSFGHGKISHDSVSVGVLFEKDLIRKQHEWIACTPTHPGLADLPAVQVGGRRASTTKIGSGSHKNPWWKCVPLYKIVWPFTSGQHLGLQRLQWHLTNTMESRHHAPPLDIFNLCIGGKFSRSYIRRLNQLIHVKCHALHLRGIFMHLPSADSSHKKSLKFFPARLTPCLSDPVRPKTQQQMNRNKLRESIWKTNGRSKWMFGRIVLGFLEPTLKRSMKPGGHSVVVAIPHRWWYVGFLVAPKSVAPRGTGCGTAGVDELDAADPAVGQQGWTGFSGLIRVYSRRDMACFLNCDPIDFRDTPMKKTDRSKA